MRATFSITKWLMEKMSSCRHPLKRLESQPYQGVAHFYCPDCKLRWTEYDAESDEDAEEIL